MANPLTGKAAKIKVTSASFSTAAAEAFTSVSPTTDRYEFRITDATKRHWTRTQPPLIFVNSTAHTDFAWNPVQGKVTFGSALSTAEGNAVTGTVYWHTASYLPVTKSWALDVSVDTHDTTALSTTATDVQWRTFIAGLANANIDLDRMVGEPSTVTPEWFDRINTDQDVIVELLINRAGSTYKYEGYALIESDAFNMDVQQLITEPVSLQVTGELYYASTE